MKEMIIKLCTVLNYIKGFTAGYSTDSFGDGKMMFDYDGKHYFMKIEEVKNPSDNILKDLHKIKYWNR